MSGAKAVREDRLWQRHADMAKLGGTPKGGVNRQALSAEDAAARNLLASWAKARGFAIFTDAIGNLFVRREGSDVTALPVMSGSHMDSQPTGGRFDGMYGVLAAFEALEALEDAGVKTMRPVVAVAWTNEEGSRFQPGAMGSAVFAGNYRLDEMLAARDWDGIVLKDALTATLAAAPAEMRQGPPGFGLHGYVGFVFGSLKSREWWSSDLMPPVFLLSAVAKAGATLLTYPLITIKTRMYTARRGDAHAAHYASIPRAMAHILRTEGGWVGGGGGRGQWRGGACAGGGRPARDRCSVAHSHVLEHCCRPHTTLRRATPTPPACCAPPHPHPRNRRGWLLPRHRH